jgi:hypothetical protein
MANSVNDFKAKLVGGGARPNLFRCEVPFPAGTGGSQEQASFMIKAAQIPAATQGTIEVPYRGRKFKIPGDRTFETWTVKVINDTTFDLRNAFENWLDIMNPAPSNSGNVAYNTFMSQLRVYQLDKAGNDVKCYTFVDAFPQSVGSIELGYETNDAIEEFDVVFNYQYWLSSSTVFTGQGGGAGIGGIISGLKSGLINAAGAAVGRATGGILGG